MKSTSWQCLLDVKIVAFLEAKKVHRGLQMTMTLHLIQRLKMIRTNIYKMSKETLRGLKQLIQRWSNKWRALTGTPRFSMRSTSKKFL